jgi:hypothetical protein
MACNRCPSAELIDEFLLLSLSALLSLDHNLMHFTVHHLGLLVSPTAITHTQKDWSQHDVIPQQVIVA